MYTGPSPDRRQQYQDQNHREILNDEPADGDAAVECFQNVTVFERSEQHHRAGDRQREAEGDAGGNIPSPVMSNRAAESSGNGDLDNRAGKRNTSNGQDIIE